MDQQYYLWAWSVYWLAASGCLLVWYRITRPIGSRMIKIFFRASAWIVLCTPWPQSDAGQTLSPAFFTMLFDGLSYGPESMLRTAPVLIGLGALLVVLLLVDGFFYNAKSQRLPSGGSAEGTTST
ncbi:hypothetical protein [Aestuariirhabdus sp. LZHN29]|uniref:hypothetical protein n=1 Tax=Aestuariirhabdus sp. LZHN29 TaxID=3417462 RepID=UPI003CF69351